MSNVLKCLYTTVKILCLQVNVLPWNNQLHQVATGESSVNFHLFICDWVVLKFPSRDWIKSWFNRLLHLHYLLIVFYSVAVLCSNWFSMKAIMTKQQDMSAVRVCCTSSDLLLQRVQLQGHCRKAHSVPAPKYICCGLASHGAARQLHPAQC